MHFNEDVKSQSRRRLLQVLQILIRQDRCDQQHGIGTSRPGLEQLIGAENELLAQQGQFHRLPHLDQNVESPLEKGLVRENGEAACTAGGISPGDGHRVKVLADHPFAGAGLLHFCDDGRLHRSLSQSCQKVPCRRQILDLTLEVLQRHPFAGCIHLTVLGPDDLFKDVSGFLLIVGNGIFQMRHAHLGVGGTTTDLHEQGGVGGDKDEPALDQATSCEAACL